jgi:hypothetical protein
MTSHSTSPPTGGKYFLLHQLHRSIQEKKMMAAIFTAKTIVVKGANKPA